MFLIFNINTLKILKNILKNINLIVFQQKNIFKNITYVGKESGGFEKEN
jgi:hypothetical protein